MKRIVFLTLCAFFGLTANAQQGQHALGLETSFGALLTENQHDVGLSPTFSTGFHYGFMPARRFGIGVGAQYNRMAFVNDNIFCMCFTTPGPRSIVEGQDLVVIPVNVELNMGCNDAAKTKVFLFAGYSYGRSFRSTSKINYADPEGVKDIATISSQGRNFHFGNAGIEVRHTLGNKFLLSSGVRFSFTTGLTDRFGEVYSVNPFLRFSRIM
jgi:hypothetical protein